MELGAEGDLNASAPSTASFPPPRPPQLASRRRALSLAVVTAVLSVAVVTAAVARLYSTPATALCWVPQATHATVGIKLAVPAAWSHL